MKRREQLYGRGGKLYYWSPEDGDVCVDLKLETPAMITLWRCDSNEPFRAIRRGEPLWKKVTAVVHGDRVTHRHILDAGPEEDIYVRDGQIYYWNMEIGEKLARPKKSSGLETFHLLGAPGVMIDFDSPLGRKLDQLQSQVNPRPKKPPRSRKKTSKKRANPRKISNVRSLVAKALS